MDNLEMLHEFFNHCNDPKTPKIRTRLISLLYQYQQIIWLQKNEGGTIELAYLKKELSQIVQNEYSIKLSSFERKLKEDLGLKVKHKKKYIFFFFLNEILFLLCIIIKVMQTTHGKRNIKLFHAPKSIASNGNKSGTFSTVNISMDSSFVSSSEMFGNSRHMGSQNFEFNQNMLPSISLPKNNVPSKPNKFHLNSILNPISQENSFSENCSEESSQHEEEFSSPPLNQNKLEIAFNFSPKSFESSPSPLENNSDPLRKMSNYEYEVAMCLTQMKSFN